MQLFLMLKLTMPGILHQHTPMYMHGVMHMMTDKFYPYKRDILEASLCEECMLQTQ
jgi:hypothetical protein